MHSSSNGSMSSSSARAVAALLGLAAIAGAGDALAYCRSTTCRATTAKGCPTDENGCVQLGAPLFWPTSCIGFAMNKLGTQQLDPEDTRATLRKCFEAWTDVQCPDGSTASMAFQENDPVDCHRSQYNKDAPNVNVILFQDNDWTYRGIDGTLAKTSVTYNDQTGEIYDADIEVNAANNQITITDDPGRIKYDLQAIITHEAGHFIGLAHSPDPSAVMFASYAPGTTGQRTLHPDDVEAVCGVYPANNGVTCNTTPRNGFSGTCEVEKKTTTACSVAPQPTPSPYGLAAVVLGAVATTVGVRRRRRAGGTA